MPVVYTKDYPMLPFGVLLNCISLELPNSKIMLIPFKFSNTEINSILPSELKSNVFNNPNIMGYCNTKEGILFLSRDGVITEYFYDKGYYNFVRIVCRIEVPELDIRVIGCYVEDQTLSFIYADVLNRRVFYKGIFIQAKDWMFEQVVTDISDLARAAYANKGKLIMQKGDKTVAY